jgi:hypothetical protein
MHLVAELSREEMIQLVDLLTHHLRQKTQTGTPSVEGLWAGKAPEDFDIDRALQEIRREWAAERDAMDRGQVP